MENKIRAVLLTTAGVLTAMLFWSWKHRPPEAVLVCTAAAETQDIYNSVTIFGTVESAESTAVCPAKNGVVSAVYAATGDTVQKGDILCTLTDIGRSQTAADYWQTAQSVFAISGTVNTVTAEDAHALYAPMDGTVLTVPQAGESVSVDMPCIQIANPDKLRVRAQSPELYVGELAVGQRANITFSAVDGTFHAELTAIAPAAVKTFSLTNEDAEATVKVFTDHRDDAAVVPYEAICQRGEQEFVFCVQDGHAVQCAVQTGYLLEDTVEIIDGLLTGVSVILSPPDELTDGDPVEVQT